MIDRDEQLELLTAYLDGEVSDAERAEVETLIAGDPAARQLFSELRQTSELVAGLPRSSVPGNFSENVVARLEREALLGSDRGASRGWTLGNWSALAASILLVVAAGWWILPQVERMRPANVGRAVVLSDVDAGPSLTDEKVAMNAEPIARDEHTSHPASTAAGMRASRGGPLPGSMTAAFEMQPEPSSAAKSKEATTQSGNDADNAIRRSLGNCVAASDAAEVDRCLNSGRLTPVKLVSADANEFTNRILVEVTDDKAVPVLGRVVEANFTLNDVPNIDDEPKDKPIGRTQRFFARQEIAKDKLALDDVSDDTKGDTPADRESADDGEVRQYVLNAPRGEVAEIVAAVQSACTANGYDTNYDVNGCQFDNNSDPAVVTGNLLSVVDDGVAESVVWDGAITTLRDPGVAGAQAAVDKNESPRSAGRGDGDGRDAIKKAMPDSDDASGAAESNDDRTRVDRDRPAEGAKDEVGTGHAYRERRGAEQKESPKRSTAEERGRSLQPGPGRIATAERQGGRGSGATSDFGLRERVFSNFVGPLPFESPDDSEIITCVVTIRPALASRSGRSRERVASPGAATTGRPAGPENESTPTTSAPTTTRPAEGHSRG